MRDLERIRQIIEDVYVRDMYRVRGRGDFSPEFHEAFRVLVPQINGRTGLCGAVSWQTADILRSSNPKAIESTTQFDFPFIDVSGDAAVAKVIILDRTTPIYTDYVSLYRIDGEWKIVSKLFNAHLDGTR
ncbi:nuclear transport factor 2 family protein [Candidatus Bipolaricaulota bacterium]|nr:nuclear transport factor 2 family protein [Candidatus Bipolaricaulota bacterium]